MLTDSLNWTIHRELWRRRALVIRAEFEKNRWLTLHVSSRTILNPFFSNVHDPRQLAAIFDKAEAELARNQHPDPVICEHSSYGPCLYHLFMHVSLAPLFPGGTKWYVCQFVVTRYNWSTFFYRERNIPVRIPASTPHSLVLQIYPSASNGTSLWSFGGRCCALALVLRFFHHQLVVDRGGCIPFTYTVDLDISWTPCAGNFGFEFCGSQS